MKLPSSYGKPPRIWSMAVQRPLKASCLKCVCIMLRPMMMLAARRFKVEHQL